MFGDHITGSSAPLHPPAPRPTAPATPVIHSPTSAPRTSAAPVRYRSPSFSGTFTCCARVAPSFCGVLTWTLALNNREKMGEAEEESTKRSIDSDNRIDLMVFDAPNPEEVGMEDGLDV